MRRDNLHHVQIESSNLETQPACEIAMGLAQVSQASIEQRLQFRSIFKSLCEENTTVQSLTKNQRLPNEISSARTDLSCRDS